MKYPTNLDGRYIVVRGRLWRCSNSHLPAGQRATVTCELMAARRDKNSAMRADDANTREQARQRIDEANKSLGSAAMLVDRWLARPQSPHEERPALR